MFGPAGANSFTQAVFDVRNLTHSDTTVRDSLYEQAMDYFQDKPFDDERIERLREKVDQARIEAESAGWRKGKAANAQVEQAEEALRQGLHEIEQKRLKRLNSAVALCTRLLQLSEGASLADTLQNSAKLLGTILLSSPCEGKKLAQLHQRFKPMYKAVLSVRLLDKLIEAESITNKYILKHYDPEIRYPEKAEGLTPFQEHVVIPVMIAAIFQDVGMFHPDARRLLLGEDGKQDEFRLLEGADRVEMLKINHTRTLEYITDGLGMQQYSGDSKDDRETFDNNEKDKLIFIRTMLNDAIKPKHGLGNLIKAPQIYTSVILSTKAGYDIRDLPKAALLIEQVAKKGAISAVAAEKLVELVGYFPQGYGVAYIPKDDMGEDLDRYEYAINTRLNPDHPKIPHCRLVTRNLEFVSFGHDAKITVERNLYFPKSRKKLQKVSKERLMEIMSKLYHDFEQRGTADLIPKCWQAYDYFSFRNNQNLWNRKTTTTI